MEASNKAIDLIKASESCAKVRKDGLVEAYPDPAKGWDVPTIGWGSTGPDVKKGTVWTKEQCDERLESHVAKVAKDLTLALGSAPTTQNQFDALVDFTYNLGIGNLKGSTLFRLHRAGSYGAAAGQFALWNKANGKVLGGLVTRRAKEKALYQS
jgi:lysozyme